MIIEFVQPGRSASARDDGGCTAEAGPDESIVGAVGRRSDGCEVVCTLSQASLGERIAMVRRDILPWVRGGVHLEDGFRLELAPEAGVRERLERWAELERACCREARFEIDETGGGLRLTVHGIEPRGTGLADLLESNAGSTPPARF
jgi:hypothetical protein